MQMSRDTPDLQEVQALLAARACSAGPSRLTPSRGCLPRPPLRTFSSRGCPFGLSGS